MVSGQRSASSSANRKKLQRPQGNQKASNAAKPACRDVYSNTLDLLGNTSSMLINQSAKNSGEANRSAAQSSYDLDGDGQFRSYIAQEAEEILDAADGKGSAKDAETQVRSCF
jgi:hypothetical protein